mgnify:CR=1 FL=1
MKSNRRSTTKGLLYTREDDEEALRLSFKSEGDRYFVVAYRNDDEFLMVGSGWSLPADAPVDAALIAANRMNARKKFVKTALWEDERDVIFTVELFLRDRTAFGDHFLRLLDALQETTTDFFAELRRA